MHYTVLYEELKNLKMPVAFFALHVCFSYANRILILWYETGNNFYTYNSPKCCLSPKICTYIKYSVSCFCIYEYDNLKV